MTVVWHDLECGPYAEDLPLWRSLADACGDPVLDVGAGTGRVALDLARHGYRVTALDREPELLAELAQRAGTLPIHTVEADARAFELGRRFPLCLVPMQTIQLLPGEHGRRTFLECARRHLVAGGVVAIAITEELELFEVFDGMLGPYPDVCERDGVVYSSQPTAVREDADGFVLERRRETLGTCGDRTVELDAVRLERLSAARLEREARHVGLRPAGRETIAATTEYSGSTVVMLRG